MTKRGRICLNSKSEIFVKSKLECRKTNLKEGFQKKQFMIEELQDELKNIKQTAFIIVDIILTCEN